MAPSSTVDEPTQLLLLAALLEPASFSQAELRSALSAAKGDLSRAAEELLLPRVKSAGKRKAGASLESWFGKKRDVTGDPATEARSEVKPMTSSSSPFTVPKAESTSAEPRRDAFALLKSTPSSVPTKAKATPQPALLLTSQAAIDKHRLPLTLLTSPLSPAFASALYLAMMDESEAWTRHKWYLAGRWVESPHTMASYHRAGGGYGMPAEEAEPSESGESEGKVKSGYYYSGMELPSSKVNIWMAQVEAHPQPYPELLRRAAELIEPVVNAALSQRARYPLEWAGSWRANVCGTNRYDGASSGVGWHADQLTYLGPYATIASLSLGTPRAFRLRETDTVDPAFKQPGGIRTYEVNLGHNSLVLMNGGCQERFKHTPGWDVGQEAISPSEQKPYTARINITFRFYREDFHPLPGVGLAGPRQGTPHCKCGIPTLLRADQKAKTRSKNAAQHKPSALPSSPAKATPESEGMIDDDMAFFWQCQSAGNTGDMKGCGFFRVLDMRAEGRGPCVIDVQEEG